MSAGVCPVRARRYRRQLQRATGAMHLQSSSSSGAGVAVPEPLVSPRGRSSCECWVDVEACRRLASMAGCGVGRGAVQLGDGGVGGGWGEDPRQDPTEMVEGRARDRLWIGVTEVGWMGVGGWEKWMRWMMACSWLLVFRAGGAATHTERSRSPESGALGAQGEDHPWESCCARGRVILAGVIPRGKAFPPPWETFQHSFPV